MAQPGPEIASLSRTDREWVRLGDVDPYYGVLSHPKYRRDALDDAALASFFSSGQEHVDHVLRVLRQRFRPDFHPLHSLDFGCGVGRVAIPLARHSRHLIAVDISPAMLREAARNAARQEVDNIHFMPTGQLDSVAPASLDLIHSVIVLQHISPRRGQNLIRLLISKLKPGGLGALHLTFARKASLAQRAAGAMRRRFSVVDSLANLLQRRKLSGPAIHMFLYPLNDVFVLLQSAGCGLVFSEFSLHRDYLGVMLYFEKTQPPLL